MTGKRLLSLLIAFALVFATMAPVSASEGMDCANMTSEMSQKSDSSQDSSSDGVSCLDKAGCLLICAKLPAPMVGEMPTAWTAGGFASFPFHGSPGIDTGPDPSPPKRAT
jgi:hypothetical protein